MTKWVGKIIIILLIFLSTSCKNVETDIIEYDLDFINEYKDDIKLLFGDIHVINKERVTETFYGYTLTTTIHYDVWEIEYLNDNQELKTIQLKNRYDFMSSIGEIIYYEMIGYLTDELDLDPDCMINFENGFDGYESLDDIDSRYYPVNLRLDELPDDLLIVISPREDKVKEFNESVTEVIERINRVKIKNVLLLYGNDAYQMDHGILVVDGEVIYEKISVEDTLKWIESNR